MIDRLVAYVVDASLRLVRRGSDTTAYIPPPPPPPPPGVFVPFPDMQIFPDDEGLYPA